MEATKPLAKTMSNNGYVKWKDFISAFLVTIVIIISLWSFNVSGGEFGQYEKRVDDKFLSFQKRFDSLETVLKDIRTEIRDLPK